MLQQPGTGEDNDGLAGNKSQDDSQGYGMVQGGGQVGKFNRNPGIDQGKKRDNQKGAPGVEVVFYVLKWGGHIVEALFQALQDALYLIISNNGLALAREPCLIV